MQREPVSVISVHGVSASPAESDDDENWCVGAERHGGPVNRKLE